MEVEQLIEKLSNGISSDIIISYLEFSNNLMFQDERLLKKCTDALNGAISKWAKEKSTTYSEIRDIFAKQDLEDKSKWYVKEMIPHSHLTHTSGSTTGQPFEYLWYMPVFNKIEWKNHYDMVLDEFDVGNAPHILYFLPHNYEVYEDRFIYCPGTRSHLNFVNHGSIRNPVIHHVNFEMYRQRPEKLFEFLFEYLKSHQIDVFYTSPPQVNSLCNYIKKFGINKRAGYLLSTTGERLLQNDAAFLLDGNYFEHICDHMRCWDGGATFFTCKYRNYHLMDNLAWCEEGPNHELICTDYFNLASPFVRYWNGDYCKIAKEYQRCECGRLYRDFEFLESRPFSLKGMNMSEIKGKIADLGIQGIKQVRCSVKDLNVVAVRELSDEEKFRISSVSEKFEFKFSVEPF